MLSGADLFTAPMEFKLRYYQILIYCRSRSIEAQPNLLRRLSLHRVRVENLLQHYHEQSISCYKRDLETEAATYQTTKP